MRVSLTTLGRKQSTGHRTTWMKVTTVTQRNTAQAIEWYRTHETAGQIGFDPDGMCQKICRTARNIGAGFPSAIAQQLGTPEHQRVYKVENIRRGMVMFFDDPNDSNPFGHIVTAVGRVKGKDPGELSSILTRTNSVKRDHVVVVIADYYPRFWGDAFKFAGTSINGVELDLPDQKPKKQPKPPLGPKGVGRLRKVVDVLDEMIDRHKDDPRLVRALRRDKQKLLDTIQRFSKVQGR